MPGLVRKILSCLLTIFAAQAHASDAVVTFSRSPEPRGFLCSVGLKASKPSKAGDRVVFVEGNLTWGMMPPGGIKLMLSLGAESDHPALDYNEHEQIWQAEIGSAGGPITDELRVQCLDSAHSFCAILDTDQSSFIAKDLLNPAPATLTIRATLYPDRAPVSLQFGLIDENKTAFQSCHRELSDLYFKKF